MMTFAKEAATARAAIIKQLADEFEASGIEYTCGKIVMDFAATRIGMLVDSPWNKTFRTLPSWRPVKLQRDTWREIHHRWNVRN